MTCSHVVYAYAPGPARSSAERDRRSAGRGGGRCSKIAGTRVDIAPMEDGTMPCDPSVFEQVPLFSLLDADERSVLAERVALRRFAPRQRIYRTGDPGAKAYIVL